MPGKFTRILTVALLAACVLLIACDRDNELTGECEIGAPAEAARQHAGLQPDGSTILLTGKRVTPVGTEIETGTFPIGVAASSTGILAVGNAGSEDHGLKERTGVSEVTRDWQSVDFIDIAGGKHLYTLPFKSNFVGIAWHPNAQTLYVSGGGRDLIRVIEWNGASASTPATQIDSFQIFGYPTGLSITKDGSRLLTTLLHRHALVEIDTSTGKEVARYTVHAAPYEVALSPDERWAVVSNWSTTTASIIDRTTGKVKHVEVGKAPEHVVFSSDSKKAYMTVSDEDVIAVIDPASATADLWSLKSSADAAEGITPTDIQISSDNKRLYVVAANENAVFVYDTTTRKKIGAIPSGQYPTGVELSQDGKHIAVVSGKGRGAGPNVNDEFVAGIIRGTVQTLTVPSDSQLAEYQAQVDTNNSVIKNVYDPECQNVKHPVPLEWGHPSEVIEHVVYIMRENKTYDSLLGDLGPEADGDPSLAVFGEEITPNLHKLARRFGNLTNFYNESEQSVQGHIWGSAGWTNDFSEKTWIAMWGRPGEAQVIVPGMEPGSVPKRGDLFRHLQGQGKSVRNYGEYMGVVLDAMQATTEPVSALKFSAYFGVDDARRADDFIHELENGTLADFTFMVLGNDHTLGLSEGSPTPEYMIADNDLATGKVVEAISKSPYWEKTVIFIFEDDPQGNADHIDAHRSICLVVSPWVKQGAQSRVIHSFPSLHRTMSMILGVTPLSKLYVDAAGMYEVFNTEPANIEPYEVVPSNIPYATNPSAKSVAKTNPKLARLIELSNKMDFSGFDKAPQLGRVLWEYRKPDQPFPEHLVSYEDEDDDDDE